MSRRRGAWPVLAVMLVTGACSLLVACSPLDEQVDEEPVPMDTARSAPGVLDPSMPPSPDPSPRAHDAQEAGPAHDGDGTTDRAHDEHDWDGPVPVLSPNDEKAAVDAFTAVALELTRQVPGEGDTARFDRLAPLFTKTGRSPAADGPVGASDATVEPRQVSMMVPFDTGDPRVLGAIVTVLYGYSTADGTWSEDDVSWQLQMTRSGGKWLVTDVDQS